MQSLRPKHLEGRCTGSSINRPSAIPTTTTRSIPYIPPQARVIPSPLCTNSPVQFLSSSRRPLTSVSIAQATSSSGLTSTSATAAETEVAPGVYQGFWTWRGYTVRYTRSGEEGPPVLLVHGFGGNADHWRKNTGVLGKKGYRAFAVDLLGYGYSSKPDPRTAPQNTLYCFETWGAQLNDFIVEKMDSQPAFLICNSVGGLAGLEASIQKPELVKGVQLLNISLRGLHVQRMASWQRPLIAAFQRVLRETELGVAFFGTVAKPETVRNILKQAYCNKDAVTDELVNCILKPGFEPGAVRVFLDFISYSGGPLPEDLMKKTTRPVSILWGEADPWEDVTLGYKLFAGIPSVKEFVRLPGVGHCPQDEAPDVVNPLVQSFCEKYA